MSKAIWLGSGLLVLWAGCTGTIDTAASADLGVDIASFDVSFRGSDCVGLQCQQHDCGEMASTTISGTVYDPAGRNPLYNVVVFVPNSAPLPLPTGASCDTCSSLYTGNPVVVALTDAAGHFTLERAPDGDNIPLVVQIGKWRRQFVIPKVGRCGATVIPDKTLTLPKSRSEGDLPNIAISTGGADTLECLLTRVGVSPSEYVAGPSGPGRIHIFTGSPRSGGGGNPVPTTSPAAPTSPSALWNAPSSLMGYDLVLLSCEGQETSAMNQSALHAYASAGGRVFASHFHYAWFNSGPYASENLATWFPGSNKIGNIAATIVTSFPKGMALKQWLGNVGALASGALPIEDARHNADVLPSHTHSQAWIQGPGTGTEYFSFNTPTDAPLGDGGVPNHCGRVVFSDLHVGGASKDYGGGSQMPVTPAGCTDQPLSAQEKALEFMLFDLSSCVVPDGLPVLPPIM